MTKDGCATPLSPRKDVLLEQVGVLTANNCESGIASAAESHSPLIPDLPRVANLYSQR